MLTALTTFARSKGDPRVIRSGASSLSPADRVGKALGWFSIGLGLAEIFAPRAITRALGMHGQEGLLRAYGAREIAAGMMSLSIDKPAGVWSRVAGDGLDLATLATAYRSDNPQRGNVGVAMAVVAGIAALDVLTAKALSVTHARNPAKLRDYSNRSGFPKGVDASRGLARKTFRTPRDMQVVPRLASGAEE